MPKKIAQRVFAGGQWWEVGDEVPDNVARTIRNPRVWSTDEDTDTDGGPQPRRADSAGPRLATTVFVGGTMYGPDDEIPDHVAAQIRNPKAWEGGELPAATRQAMADDERTGTEQAAGAEQPTGERAGDDAAATAAQATPDGDRVPAPPRTGAGSGREAWRTFLRANGVPVDGNASREDLIATAEREGLIEKE